MKIYRLIDANINRVSEGLRILEDIARFVLENKALSKDIREMRHIVRKSFTNHSLLIFRDSQNDIGLNISQNSRLDAKKAVSDLISANFKRVQEGLRSIEEALKILGYFNESKIYEALRFKSYDLEKKFSIRKTLPDTDIYGILGEEFSAGKSNIEITKEMIKANIKIIQYREKNKSKCDKLKDCQAIRKITSVNDVIFIVNDDIDIALAVKADGIHIGQKDMPIEIVKNIASDMIIGLSTHNQKQALEAVEKGADYIGVGPIFNTSTKKNLEKCDGLSFLKWVSENISIPFVAIGGIKESNIATVKKHGGKYFAMISELVGSENIVKKINLIRKKLY
ncbi:thiamine phosphate synthase [Paramaledivibacter caminithermalis]|jgi:thiamine-phosphate pyrophosphorylase|uniref:Thiamine-phosphate synthase n=1 Tax=Paramaledivibacter caminithermalis (strain DSM 15212 / CIP 107654 / DViRD3) TaxID=1121301 RepID=A0A1M6QI69_PARC5|nr:thiamine phosphate synthase [Paramaledivibacter caminithermalis]SHK19717.1 thiamine-phosphate pyrophosphorylase [Paramaledivibacter caminithermalis DSM 15212]